MPGYESSIWWGIIGPVGIPEPIVMRLNAEIGAVLKDPEMVKRLQNESAESIIAGPDALARLIASEIKKWVRVAKETDIRVE